MASTSNPSDAPPSYDQATKTPAASRHQTRNGIPPERRRSMEDESRPVPAGWVRQFDAESGHQFFVDITKEPPRSIWSHPFDDETYLNSLSKDERAHVTRLHRSVSLKDIEAESSDDEAGPSQAKKVAPGTGAGAGVDDHPTGIKKFGRKLKDRMTHTTHQEREKERQQRAREEEEAYRLHMAFRAAMSRAIQTGKPQYIGKDKNGKDMFIEPPGGTMPARAQNVPGGSMGYNPYHQGPYGNPNAVYLRPSNPYARPYGYGYGGGYGLPIAGGLLGGALLGGLLF